MTRSDRYVGPAEIATRVVDSGSRIILESVNDLSNSLHLMDGYVNGESFTVTFVSRRYLRTGTSTDQNFASR